MLNWINIKLKYILYCYCTNYNEVEQLEKHQTDKDKRIRDVEADLVKAVNEKQSISDKYEQLLVKSTTTEQYLQEEAHRYKNQYLESIFATLWSVKRTNSSLSWPIIGQLNEAFVFLMDTSMDKIKISGISTSLSSS